MTRTCPRCGSDVFRVPRRPVDRLLSIVRPVQRYQCSALECEWCGNLPRKSLPRVEQTVTLSKLSATR